MLVIDQDTGRCADIDDRLNQTKELTSEVKKK